jgi:hypothetical protein
MYKQLKIGDLVWTGLTGLGAPSRRVMGLLIRPIAASFWNVLLLEEKTHICIPTTELELFSASR